MKRSVLFLCLMLTGGGLTPLFSQTDSLIHLNQILSETYKNSERLTSGRILWTDSPSSRAIYEKLESHIRSMAANIRNTGDLISYQNVRDGYLKIMIDYLQRIRVLTLKRSDGFYGPDERDILDSEIFTLYKGILEEISQAQFNTIPLFASWKGDENISSRFKEDAFYTTDGVDRILTFLISERARTGALINTLKRRETGLSVEEENANAFQSRGDTDFARELSDLQKNEILLFSNLFLLKMDK